MNRSSFVKLFVICLVTPFLLAAKPARNVVIFVTDDQGVEAGCYGNKVIKTPHMDALAADGTRFDFAFCTTSSCSPSRSVILSGLHNHMNGQYGLAHADHNFHSRTFVQGLPNLLNSAGYRSICIAKYHVQPEANYQFERIDAKVNGHSAVELAERAEKFIREADDRPFFVYVGSTDPHRDFGNKREYPGVKEVKYDPATITVPHFLPDTPEAKAELAELYQSVSRADQGLGRLIQVLKETGHYDDTLILFLTDNGIPFPGAKTNLYEPGMRLPLVVRSPDQKQRGVVSQAMVSWVDLVPTVLDFAGAKGPSYDLHGRSFLKVLDQPKVTGWDEVFGSHSFHEVTMYYPMRVIRTRKHKLILNIAHPLSFPFASDLFGSTTWQGVLKRDDAMYGSRSTTAYLHRPKFELYDLEADPRELVNLADKPAHAKTLAELQGRLRTWQEKTKDPWNVKYTHE
ncbi:MAG: sulfatase [Planctomycetales bacterium]|nr:sulfatase [Planctomycetales bacterium]